MKVEDECNSIIVEASRQGMGFYILRKSPLVLCVGGELVAEQH